MRRWIYPKWETGSVRSGAQGASSFDPRYPDVAGAAGRVMLKTGQKCLDGAVLVDVVGISEVLGGKGACTGQAHGDNGDAGIELAAEEQVDIGSQASVGADVAVAAAESSA